MPQKFPTPSSVSRFNFLDYLKNQYLVPATQATFRAENKLKSIPNAISQAISPLKNISPQNPFQAAAYAGMPITQVVDMLIGQYGADKFKGQNVLDTSTSQGIENKPKTSPTLKVLTDPRTYSGHAANPMRMITDFPFLKKENRDFFKKLYAETPEEIRKHPKWDTGNLIGNLQSVFNHKYFIDTGPTGYGYKGNEKPKTRVEDAAPGPVRDFVAYRNVFNEPLKYNQTVIEDTVKNLQTKWEEVPASELPAEIRKTGKTFYRQSEKGKSYLDRKHAAEILSLLKPQEMAINTVPNLVAGAVNMADVGLRLLRNDTEYAKHGAKMAMGQLGKGVAGAYMGATGGSLNPLNVLLSNYTVKPVQAAEAIVPENNPEYLNSPNPVQKALWNIPHDEEQLLRTIKFPSPSTVSKAASNVLSQLQGKQSDFSKNRLLQALGVGLPITQLPQRLSDAARGLSETAQATQDYIDPAKRTPENLSKILAYLPIVGATAKGGSKAVFQAEEQKKGLIERLFGKKVLSPTEVKSKYADELNNLMSDQEKKDLMVIQRTRAYQQSQPFISETQPKGNVRLADLVKPGEYANYGDFRSTLRSQGLDLMADYTNVINASQTDPQKYKGVIEDLGNTMLNEPKYSQYWEQIRGSMQYNGIAPTMPQSGAIDMNAPIGGGTPRMVYRVEGPSTSGQTLGKGKYVAFDPQNVTRYGKDIKPFEIDSKARMLDLSDPNKLQTITDDAIRANREQFMQVMKTKGPDEAVSTVLTDWAKKLGYDGIIGDDKAFGTVIFNEKMLKPAGAYIGNEQLSQLRQTRVPEPTLDEKITQTKANIQKLKSGELTKPPVGSLEEAKVAQPVTIQKALEIEQDIQRANVKIQQDFLDGKITQPQRNKLMTENLKRSTSNVQPPVSEVKPIYHGTPEKFDKFDVNRSEGGATWFTADKGEILSGKAGAVQGKGQKLNIMERYPKPNLKLATPEQADKLYTDQLIAEGYRGVKYPAEKGQAEWTKLWFPNEDTVIKPNVAQGGTTTKIKNPEAGFIDFGASDTQIPKDLQSLAQQAQQYKTPEQFRQSLTDYVKTKNGIGRLNPAELKKITELRSSPQALQDFFNKAIQSTGEAGRFIKNILNLNK